MCISFTFADTFFNILRAEILECTIFNDVHCLQKFHTKFARKLVAIDIITIYTPQFLNFCPVLISAILFSLGKLFWLFQLRKTARKIVGYFLIHLVHTLGKYKERKKSINELGKSIRQSKTAPFGKEELFCYVVLYYTGKQIRLSCSLASWHGIMEYSCFYLTDLQHRLKISRVSN